MAGSYPDVPAPRIPYDVNGSLCYHVTGHIPVLVSGTPVTDINSETYNAAAPSGYLDDSYNESINGFVIIFQQPYDLYGFWINRGPVRSWDYCDVYTSTDTTNGVDGTWTRQAAATAPSPAVGPPPAYRTIHGITAPGAVAIKITNVNGSYGTWSVENFHVYGHPSTNTGDRLEFWHPTLDQPLHQTPAFMDWGDVSRGTPTPPTKDVRIKNLASLLTANSIVVGYQALTDGGGNYVAAHSLSIDNGGTYHSVVTLGSLAPGQISDPIRVQYAPLVTDELSVHTGRLFTTTGSWT